MADSFRHLFLQNSGIITRYVPRGGGGGDKSYPKRNRRNHSAKLQLRLNTIWEEEEKSAEARTAVGLPVRHGTYLQFESADDHDLAINRLENKPQGIRLANVRHVKAADEDSKSKTYATVYVPAGKESHFIKKFAAYASEDTRGDNPKPKNQELATSVEDIKRAVVDSFWQDSPDLQPAATEQWCEIWLRSSEKKDVVALFRELAATLQIDVQAEVLRFPERMVVLALTTMANLTVLVAASDAIAEFRRAKETARFFLDSENEAQTEWVDELVSRVSVSDNPLVAITILDSGVNNGHVLLKPVLGDADRQAVNLAWGTTDHHHRGHGTRMSGIAAYGDLQQRLIDTAPITLAHCLESVKILPPSGVNEPSLYGQITIQAVSLAEIQAPQRQHIPCMAVTAPDSFGRGRPSSWSAAIDQLTAGAENSLKYLFIVAAGNVEDPNEWNRYPSSNLTSSVHDPAQAWNAIAVGAYTEKIRITQLSLRGHSPVATAGGLSPFSTTSLTWVTNKWPSKPDIVMEGGNAARSPNHNFVADCDDLSLLTTGEQPTGRQLELFNMTSAATAKAGWLAAQIQSAYPNAWPETVRGLMVHSAEWTPTMLREHVPNHTKSEYAQLLRICGYGVPRVDKAINCYRNSLTLVAEESFQPFEKKPGASTYRMKEMHFHDLPWPSDVLLDLGETIVTLRITLSYFIEPSPGEIGWQDRYRYPSHALRFDINNAGETRETFRAQMNKAERQANQQYSARSDGNWTIGANGRNRGSLHSDIWRGTAADLATRNFVAVYPVGGWWKDRPWLGKAEQRIRYSLVVSIHTPAQDVDIYTPIAAIVDTPIDIDISI